MIRGEETGGGGGGGGMKGGCGWEGMGRGGWLDLLGWGLG